MISQITWLWCLCTHNSLWASLKFSTTLSLFFFLIKSQNYYNTLLVLAIHTNKQNLDVLSYILGFNSYKMHSATYVTEHDIRHFIRQIKNFCWQDKYSNTQMLILLTKYFIASAFEFGDYTIKYVRGLTVLTLFNYVLFNLFNPVLHHFMFKVWKTCILESKPLWFTPQKQPQLCGALKSPWVTQASVLFFVV